MRVLALDAGGTMTDSFLLDGTGTFVVGKAQSNPHDEASAVMESVGDALGYWGTSAEAALPSLASAVFSGTAMLNRLLERKGQRVGCIVSGGLEDCLRLERGVQTWLGMSYADRLHVTTHYHNEPLVPRSRMRGVRGRIDVFGDEAIPLYDHEARAAVEELLDEAVEAIVVSLLHSYCNPAHERRVREIAAEAKERRGLNGNVPVFLSSDLYPTRGDLPRLNSTLIEAYAAEPSRGQLERVEQAFHDAGARVGLRIMASHGGTISVRAKELARTLVSGPIGGVVGARHLAREFEIENVVCSDIGGTSFDLALIIGGETPIRPTPDIGRYLLNLPMVEIESIGAGTGSFVRIDPSSNRPEIGPDSAGARIGVSWRDGGLETVSVTDLDVVLGRLNPDYFLGGQVELDVEYARHAVERQLARPLGLDVEEAAGGIVDLFEESLRYAALARVLGKGYAPVDFSLFCYGGGGPLHVAGYTRDAGYADVLVPTWAAGFSAFGCACADYEYRYDMTTSIPVVTDAAGAELREAERRLAADWVDLRGRVRSEFAKSGVDDGAVEYRFLVRMQYSGQLNDIEIAAPDGDGTPNVLALVAAFEETYGKIYARGARSPELGYVITAAIVTGSTPIEKPVLPVEDEVAVPPLPKLSRPVWWSTELGRLETPVFEQDDLRAGHCVAGPAIIESPASTFVVPPGRAATLDRTRIFHLDTEALA